MLASIQPAANENVMFTDSHHCMPYVYVKIRFRWPCKTALQQQSIFHVNKYYLALIITFNLCVMQIADSALLFFNEITALAPPGNC